MKTQFQKYLAIISAFVILLSMALPAFATEPPSTDAAIDYDQLVCATWYIDLDSKSIDDYVYPDATFTWSGTMEALATGIPSSLKVFKSPDPSVDGNSGTLFDIKDRYGLSLGTASCIMMPGADGPEIVTGKNLSCGVSKIVIVSPDPVSANNEKLYKWFKANGFFSASTPNQGGSSGDDATEQVAGLAYSFWQLNETIIPPDPLSSFTASFTLPYVNPDTIYSTFSFDASNLKYGSLFVYSFANGVWLNDKYRYVYFGAQGTSEVGLLRWLKDNGRLIVQSEPSPKPTVIDDLNGLTFSFDRSFVRPTGGLDVECMHATDINPNSALAHIRYVKNGYPKNTEFLYGNGGTLWDYDPFNPSGWKAKWIKFTDHCTDRKLIEWIMQSATLTGWPTEPPQIPAYAPPEVGGVLGSLQVDSSGEGNQSGWITGGGLIGTQPLPGLNAGFLSWLAGTMDGIMNVNLFGFFSIADILSFCLTISIILILLKFFGG